MQDIFGLAMGLVTGLQFAVLEMCRLFACDCHQVMTIVEGRSLRFLVSVVDPRPFYNLLMRIMVFFSKVLLRLLLGYNTGKIEG